MAKKNPDYKRPLRERNRPRYLESSDSDTEAGWAFDIEEKLASPKFIRPGMYKEINGYELTMAYIQQNGFDTPLLVKEKTGLGIKVPPSDISIGKVTKLVGSKRLLPVLDVNNDSIPSMTMKEWQKYFEDPNRKKLLNVIFECSDTKLDAHVEAPKIVRELDWIDVAWPRSLKELDDYPKVQKYLLMTAGGYFTDFHFDFGGTSVWYHVLKGEKVFWLIPPTEENLKRYVKSIKEPSIFFGDLVDNCVRVDLKPGNTFFIPPGWIHAVFTPSDSIVFGANFLHSFGIEKQLKIAEIENKIKMPMKERLSRFNEIHWYVLARYVFSLLGHSHLEGEADRKVDSKHVYLTKFEISGIEAILSYLEGLPSSKRNVPEMIDDADGILQDIRALLSLHSNDDPQLAVTGVPILKAEFDSIDQASTSNSGNCRAKLKRANNIDSDENEVPSKSRKLVQVESNFTSTLNTTNKRSSLKRKVDESSKENDDEIIPQKVRKH